jgi:hypothetical protein
MINLIKKLIKKLRSKKNSESQIKKNPETEIGFPNEETIIYD